MSRKQENLKVYLAFSALVLLASLFYFTGSLNVVNFEPILHSNESSFGWTKPGFDDSSWNTAGKLFLSYKELREIYLRQYFDAQEGSKVFHISADDCILEIYLNGVQIYDSNCTPGLHATGEDFILRPLNPGENLLAIKVYNVGGPSMLKVEQAKSSLPLLLAALLIIAFAYLLHSLRIPGDSLKVTALVFTLTLLFLSSIAGFIDFHAASLLLIAACAIYLLFSSGELLENPYKIFILFLALSSAFLLPIFNNLENWGRGDWDAFYSLTYIPLKSFFEYRELPLWNPYMCGGMTLIGDPEVAFFSPQVIPVILFGISAGIRVNILLHLCLALFGMWLLGKHFGLSGYSRIFPPFVYAFSSIYFKHMWEGHYTWLAHAWVPFVLYYYLEGLKDAKKLVLSGIFSAFILFNGNINYLGYTFLLLGFYSLAETLLRKENLKTFSGVRNKLKPVLSLIAVLIVFSLVSAVKLLPLIEHRSEAPRIGYDNPSLTYSDLYVSLVSPELYGKWHESSAYIGYIALGLIILGMLIFFRKNSMLLLSCVFFILILLNNNSPIRLWEFIRELPLYDSIRMIPRVVTFVILTGSIFGGLVLRAVGVMSKSLSKVILLAVLFNLFFVSPFALDEWFMIEPHYTNSSNYGSSSFNQIEYTFEDVPHASSDMYRLILLNKGVINCWSPVSLPIRAVPYNKSEYIGEAYLAGGNGTTSIINYTPNSIKVKVNALSNDILILNQNYYTGWRASTGPAEPYQGLISTKINTGVQEIEFYYLPESFIIGALITAATLLLIGALAAYIKFIHNPKAMRKSHR